MGGLRVEPPGRGMRSVR